MDQGAMASTVADGGRFIRQRRDFVPAHVRTHEQGQLAERVQAVRKLLNSCRLCPRVCQVNRTDNQKGVCGTGRRARVASAFAHFGEEACLRGRNGSGTIFFGGCNLGCVFCQNAEISQGGAGREQEAQELATRMLALQAAGCHNLNLVTPTHVVPQILEALLWADEAGLHLPLVYNTGGYDNLETLRLLDGVVDIYMPDFKLWDGHWCGQYLRAPDYAAAARRALQEMHRQVGVLCLDEEGVALRGVLVRHLVMPGLLQETRSICQWLARELSPDTYLNLMAQYQPNHQAVTDPRWRQLQRGLSPAEFQQALQHAAAAGLWRLDSHP